jgi:nucleoside-diphosphate-sugar epimerase
MKKVLVSGAAGFIGSYLCRRLSEKGYYVIPIDNLSNGIKERFELLNPNLELNILNILDYKPCSNTKIDIFFDLAYINGTKQFYTRGDEILEFAGKSVFNSISIAKQTGARLVYFSTPEAYGYPDVIPTPEVSPLKIMDITNPRWSYAIGKIFSESVLQCNYESGAFKDFIVVRPNNAYGPYDRFHVIADLINKLSKCPDELIVEGEGEDVRCYCFIEDMVSQIITLAEFSPQREIYNLGNSDETSIENLCHEIQSVYGTDIPIKFISAKRGSPKKRVPDISKVLKLMGSQKITNLTDGISAIRKHKELDPYSKC